MNVEIIAEIAQAHEGSLGIAHSYIDALADTGIDIIKFQTHIAAAESSPKEPFRVRFSYEDETRFDYWRRMEFSLDQWRGLKKHCDEVGLEFMSTPTCLAAVELLEKVGVKRYKVGSGDLTNKLLLKRIAETDKPVMISTGMSTINDVKQTVNYIKQLGNQYAILHCTSKYPTAPKDIRLDIINKYKSEFDCPIGFSDHSGTIWPSLAATVLGAEIIEVHVVFAKKMFGPDSSSSLTIDEIRALLEGIRYIEKSWENSTNSALGDDLVKMKSIFEKSLSVNKHLKKGHIISFNDLESKKPSGMGIPPSQFEEVLGKKLRTDKNECDFLNYENLE